MLAFLLGFFGCLSCSGKVMAALPWRDLALRQQLSIYQRKHKRLRLVGRDCWF
jgi:hypothetical protein